MKIQKILILIFSLLFVNVLLAQEATSETIDIVYLKDGSVFKGKILEYHQGKTLRLQLADSGVEITLYSRKVKKIKHGAVGETVKRPKRPYQFKEKGFYYTAYVSANSGGSAFNTDETDQGLGVQTSFGYQFHRLLGVGAGIGMDYYYNGSGNNFMPIFAEVRGYVFSKNITPTYSFAAGYAYAFADEDRGITEAEGGLMLYPAVGFRFGGSKTMNFTMDAGVKIQEGRFVFTDWDTLEYKMRYKRLVIRVGVLF